MMSIEYFVLGLIIMGSIGAYLSYRHGVTEYAEGMKQALLMHHSGDLKYKVYFEGDVEMIEIKVREDEK